MTNSASDIEEIKSVLLNQSPFLETSVRYQNIWGQNFLDVEFLNAHASDAVLHAVEHKRTTSIVVTAEYGTGKSHIISRIRHCLQVQNGALFVYANKYGDIKQIKQAFQSILADSLSNLGSQNIRQWQELATAMVNAALKVAQPNKPSLASQELLRKFDNSSPDQAQRWVKGLIKHFCETTDVRNPDIVRAIFWTLSSEQVLYAINWLAGQEIAQYKANELGLPTQNQSFDTVLHILDLISEYRKLIICFDELDNPEIDPDTSLTRAQVVSGLVKELFENLKCGVILSVMLPNVWKHKVQPMPGLSWRKVSDYGEPINLKFVDENSIIELVRLRLKEFYKSHNLIPPNPTYPFTENQLRELGKRKSATVREVLIWCRENIPKILGSSGNPPVDPVELAFDTEIKEQLGNYLDDNFLIADALLFNFQTLIGQTIERVVINKVTDDVKKLGGKDGYINFKIIGREDGKKVCIGVAVLQQSGGKSLGTGLSRLNDYGTFGLTRGCLIRSKAKKITPHLEKTYIEPLIKNKGGEFVELRENEIRPLIAIRTVHQKLNVDYKEITEKQLFQFIADKGSKIMLGTSNPLLREVLSNPSYKVPTDLIEEEPLVSIESSVDTSSSNDIEELRVS